MQAIATVGDRKFRAAGDLLPPYFHSWSAEQFAHTYPDGCRFVSSRWNSVAERDEWLGRLRQFQPTVTPPVGHWELRFHRTADGFIATAPADDDHANTLVDCGWEEIAKEGSI